MTVDPSVKDASPIKGATFATIAKLAKSEAGLVLPEGKMTMVQSRLRARIRAMGLPDINAYAKYVASNDGIAERRNMISALTTNVSHFFRESHHFDILRHQVLPTLVERAASGGRVRIWSAGCSSGQEPYSIAMTLLSAAPELSHRDVLVLGSDIDPRILNAAEAGRYSEQQISGIPEPMRRDFLKPAGDGEYEVQTNVRKLVRFRELNLHRDWPMRSAFDVIFCRNVVIYFDLAAQAALWPRFHKVLAPDGWFFLGHSERISDSALKLFQSAGPTAYKPLTSTPPSVPILFDEE